MRQPAIAFTALLATTFAMTNVVYADEQADKQAIIESYRTLDGGIQRKNLNQAFSIYAPEFTQVEMDGKVRNLEQIRKDWQQDIQNIRQIQVMREHQITINGQTATEVGTAYQTTLFLNPNNPQVPIPVSTVFQYQATWKRTNSGWKATNARILQSSNAGGQQSSAKGYRTIIITNDNSLPISWLRMRPVNTKTKWHQLMSITEYLEEGHTKTFKVSTDQCKYTFVAAYINGTLDPSVLNVCGGDKTTPIRITYTGVGGTHDVTGKYIGDNPDCQPINGWVSGIINAPTPLSCR